MKSYTFVLNFGYVESCRLSFLPFTSLGKYRSAKEALMDLAEFLKEQYLIQFEPKPKKCCLASKEKKDSSEFCSKCGSSLMAEEFTDEHFMDWVCQLNDCSNDSFHGEYIDYDINHRWQSNGLEGAINPRFVYEAEWVLAAALGYPHNQNRTFEVICKERTKKKVEGFSYF